MVKVEWIPPYWQAGSEDKIVDPTGAGNSFMGGCGAALMQGHDVREGEWTSHRLSDSRGEGRSMG
jgi:sugar/nucleoside kinase (ribokinase family)